VRNKSNEALASAGPLPGQYGLEPKGGMQRAANRDAADAKSSGCTAETGCRMETMNVDELEAQALKLDHKSRARLAERLLVSLDELSEQESEQLWAAEAQRRDAQMDADPGSSRPADDVFREAWSRIK
jgi:hypothetical protein